MRASPASSHSFVAFVHPHVYTFVFHLLIATPTTLSGCPSNVCSCSFPDMSSLFKLWIILHYSSFYCTSVVMSHPTLFFPTPPCCKISQPTFQYFSSLPFSHLISALCSRMRPEKVVSHVAVSGLNSLSPYQRLSLSPIGF